MLNKDDLEVGITYRCRVDDDDNGDSYQRELTYLPLEDSDPSPWRGKARWFRNNHVTPIRPVTARITDEGGHWEPGDKHPGMEARRRVEYAAGSAIGTWEVWLPDAPPVVIPTGPAWGIVDYVTPNGIEWSGALARLYSSGSMRVFEPNGDGEAFVADLVAGQYVTSWRAIPNPAVQL